MNNNLLQINDYIRDYKKIERRPNGLFVVLNYDGLYSLFNANGKKISLDYNFVYNFEDGKAMVEKDGLYGCIDESGKEVLKCKYARFDNDFYDGLSIVKNKDNLYGFINTDFKEVIKCKYKDVGFFSEGLCAVKNDKGKWGYINNKDEVIIPFIYNNALNFSEGLAGVEINNKWGYIDKKGDLEIPFKYDYYVYNFSEGKAAVQNESCYWGFIDRTGNEIIPCKYENVFEFKKNMAAVRYDGYWGIIDENDNTIVPFEYNGGTDILDCGAIIGEEKNNFGPLGTDYLLDKNGNIIGKVSNILDFEDKDLIKVTSGKRVKFVDKDSNTIIDLKDKYNKVDDFVNGFLKVQGNYHACGDLYYGFIDKTGKEITRLKYYDAHNFSEGLCAVKKVDLCKLRCGIDNGAWGFINTEGKEVIKFVFDDVSDFSEGFACVKKEGLYGFIDTNGNEVIKCKHKGAKSFSDGLAAVYDGEYWGYMNKKGRIVIPCNFKEVDYFKNGLAKVTDQYENTYYINQKGKYVFGFEYYSEIHIDNQDISIRAASKQELIKEKLKIFSKARHKYGYAYPNAVYRIESKEEYEKAIKEVNNLLFSIELYEAENELNNETKLIRRK